ncbi:hypothetical protein [Candidatus Sodalis endolongispinus]|uniref:hypothetical protein n=1 Tax=Candidatus Sodalis endolongispinus TaxID=2812662 RepID=UPI00406BAE7E
MIPQQIAELLVGIGQSQGGWVFLLLTILILIVFGAVLGGARINHFFPYSGAYCHTVGLQSVAFRYCHDSGDGLWSVFAADWAWLVYHLRHQRGRNEKCDSPDDKIFAGLPRRYHPDRIDPDDIHLVALFGRLLMPTYRTA